MIELMTEPKSKTRIGYTDGKSEEFVLWCCTRNQRPTEVIQPLDTTSPNLFRRTGVMESDTEFFPLKNGDRYFTDMTPELASSIAKSNVEKFWELHYSAIYASKEEAVAWVTQKFLMQDFPVLQVWNDDQM